ncbi:hypothetical protein J4G33_10255 [Actinotalea sp. BY-33]|uniref:SRPBCC family protein n=1 Tax=Actinotalea soli TaxID=2819234 RepID=A0A939RW11_9CELL|nr:hypothetical protein [Actinotalea soli]MBO1752183.1 hypothetical protein [Actinotalea soli]
MTKPSDAPDAPDDAARAAGPRTPRSPDVEPHGAPLGGACGEPRAAVARRVLPLRAEEAWDLVTDVHHHERWVPMTRIDGPAALGVGDVFVGVTGPGALHGGPGLADRMRVERLEPPVTEPAGPGRTGVAVYRKLGPVLLGTAEVHVRPLGPGLCEVAWVERVHLRGLPRALTTAPLRPVLGGMGWYVLRQVAREVAARDEHH